MRRKPLPLSEIELGILLHALGIQNRNGEWSKGGWRNHYGIDEGCDDFKVCQALTAAGWMRGCNPRGPFVEECTFCVSRAGIAALRLAGWEIEEER